MPQCIEIYGRGDLPAVVIQGHEQIRGEKIGLAFNIFLILRPVEHVIIAAQKLISEQAMQDVMPKLMGLGEADPAWRQDRIAVEEHPLLAPLARKQSAFKPLDGLAAHFAYGIVPVEDTRRFQCQGRHIDGKPV